MKRTLSRIASLALATLAVVGVSSCSEANKVISVGVILPLSGEFAIYGDPIRRGIELAFEEIQLDTEYPFQLELKEFDSQGDAARARQLLIDVYKGGAPAALGGAISSEALAMVEVADEYGRVLLSPSASTPSLTGISTNFFRVFPSDFLEGTRMGNFASKSLEGSSKVVILAAESDYAKGVQSVFRSEYERYGGEVLEVIEYPQNTSDFAALIERAMSLGPGSVYVADYASAISKMVRDLRGAGFKGTILTTSSFAAPDAISSAGEAAEGVFLTQSTFDVDSQDPTIRRFVDAYRAKYGSDPDLYAAHGYDAMNVWAAALEKGGGSLPSEFWRGMRGLRDFQGVTGSIQFDERGDVQKFPRVYVVKDGELVDHEKRLEELREQGRKKLEELNRQLRQLRQNGGSGN